MNLRQPNEDLFDSSRMSFGEHLEELRKVLVWALYGLIPASIIGFYFAEDIVQILNQPLRNAIAEYKDYDAKQELIKRNGFIPPEYLGRMDQEGLLPRQVYMDPGQMLAMLQEVIPDLGSKVELDSYGFKSSDFNRDRLVALCKRLSSQSGGDVATNIKLTAMWKLIPESEQAVIKTVSTLSQPTVADLNKVVEIFNRLSKVDKLSDDEAFKEELTEAQSGFMAMFLGPQKPKPLAKMKTLLSESYDSTINRRLNRALIFAAFPDQMSPIGQDVLPVEIWEKYEFEPQSLGVSEGFLVWLKAGIFTGLTLAGPWIFFQLWSFVATGLYPHEKKYIHLFLPISIVLFISGVLLAFFFVFQPVLGFLFSFNRAMGIEPDMRINDWLSFVMFLPLGFGTAFQLPLVMLFMNRIGLFQIADYLSKWRIAVMIIFVLAMFLTPADPISMLLLAVPLTGLYFLGIGLCKWMPRAENPYGEDAAAVADA